MKLRINKRYSPKQLSRKDKQKYVKSILKSKKLYKKGIYFTRPKVKSFKNKKSGHVANAKRMYKVENISANAKLSKKTGCSVNALAKIIRKGQGAYFSSGSRPNQTSHSWGIARLGSAITGGKSSIVDYEILQKGCKKSSKALKLANRLVRKSGRKPKSAKKISINLKK
jgi:hypothetical protein